MIAGRTGLQRPGDPGRSAKISMNENHPGIDSGRLELWGGVECTYNRVGDNFHCQLSRNGHAGRLDDLERFAALGIKAIRYPLLWERTAPDGLESADWSWADERLARLHELGVTPILGFVHHGSGPRHTSLLDPAFAEKLAEFAGAAAERYPWVEYYTPVNEPLTTARFSGLYGIWYPHGRDDRTFITALLNQCRAIVLSMQAIRRINPQAKLVQTDDLGKTYGTPAMSHVADFYNKRRWLAWDLLCGTVGPEHELWDSLTETGIAPDEFLWFRENPCPPDIVGVNYYVTSERWLDERIERYPEHHVDRAKGFADIEAARALATPTPGIGPLLQEAWERYGLPLAVTEVHIDTTREDQMRWLLEIWQAAGKLRLQGADVRAVTVWALLGSYDWNSLVTRDNGHYESGAFDLRSPSPRPTAIASLMRELADGRPASHPVLHGNGWWRRSDRFFCPPVAMQETVTSLFDQKRNVVPNRPILISGSTGTLGCAFGRICGQRNLSYRLLTRREMDIAVPESVENAIRQYRPWAIINAGGFVRVDDAEHAAELCLRENTVGPAVLADACARHGLRLVTFSSDLVFDGAKGAPYCESDQTAPLNVYGRSKVEAEKRVLDRHTDALVVRTSAFFGPWDKHNFITLALRELMQGKPFFAASDATVSPTYIPDLVNICLDLLIDGETGIWHLSNGGSITWIDLAKAACDCVGIDPGRLEGRPGRHLNQVAPRPAYSVLTSERALLMPALDNALERYVSASSDLLRGFGLSKAAGGI